MAESMERRLVIEALESRELLSATPGLNPVLLVPGFAGSFAADVSEAGLREWYTTRGIAPEKLALEPLSDGYQDLVKSLENVGYVDGETLFVAVWDWRTPVAPSDGTADGQVTGVTGASVSDTTFETGLDYLGYFLKQAGDAYAASHEGAVLASVDLITHSTGGLVARSYIESTAYGDGLPTVDNLVLAGVPNEGAADPWEMLNNDFNGNPAKRLLGRLINNAYELLLDGHDIVGPNGSTLQASTWVDSPEARDSFIGQYVATLHDLLPTFAFLDHTGDGSFQPLTSNFVNDLLVDPNSNPQNPDAFIDQTGKTTVVYSDSETTISGSIERIGPSLAPAVLPFDEYVENRAVSGEVYYEQVKTNNGGDSTVITASALPAWFDAPSSKLAVEQITSSLAGEPVGHRLLVQNSYAQERILAAIGVTGVTSGDISTPL